MNKNKIISQMAYISGQHKDDLSKSLMAKFPTMYQNPSIIEERQLNITQMDVFSRLMMDRIIMVGGAIDSDLCNIVNSQMLWLASVDDKDIQMHINSPGGSVYDGLGTIDTMDYVKPDVNTMNTGMAASMGAMFLAHGAKRSALPHSRTMIHQPMGGVSGQESDIEITAREIKKLKNELYELLSYNSGKTINQITNDADRDYWMTADETLKYGLIDEVIKTKRPVRNHKK